MATSAKTRGSLWRGTRDRSRLPRPPIPLYDALWADAEARRLEALQSELLERVGRLNLAASQLTRALAAADRAYALDPSNERPVQLALEAEAALGRREAVVERCERLRRELEEQFGLEPSRETKSLYRCLLSQGAADAGERRRAVR